LSAIGTNQVLDTSSVLGLGGTAFTDSHITLLRAKGIRYVCLSLDPDKAGYKAMYSIAIKLLMNGFKVKVAILPNGKDPMDLIQMRKTEELKRILTNPIDATEYIVRYFNSLNKNLSFFRYIQRVEEFFNEVDTSKLSKLKDPKPKTLGWFINRSKK
jgi:DNA primase